MLVLESLQSFSENQNPATASSAIVCSSSNDTLFKRGEAKGVDAMTAHEGHDLISEITESDTLSSDSSEGTIDTSLDGHSAEMDNTSSDDSTAFDGKY